MLDEIQKFIVADTLNAVYDYRLGGVFQMPQDDEVDRWGNEVDDEVIE